MFGAFRSTNVTLGGLLWKVPWRMSASRKANVRKRLRQVDEVVETLTQSGFTCKRLEAFKELPKESEMAPKEKYTVFCKSAKDHRKALHKVPKYTKIPHPRISPPGF